MAKLQIRFEQSELDVIIHALELQVDEQARLSDVREAGRLASWLTWRRDKFWGPPASEHAPAREPVRVEAIIEADGKDHGRTRVGGHEVMAYPQRAPQLSTVCG